MSLVGDMEGLRLPVIGAPMFIVSNPELVIAQCRAGIIGSFPALNARPASELATWLQRITTTLAADRAAAPGTYVAPFAVNQIVHASNARLEEDLETCAAYRVPILITSLRAPHAAVEVAHDYGGLVFHDVVNVRHAQKAVEAGVDGLIAVCTGAGGHAGSLNPFALVSEIRRFWDGPLAVSGAITRGNQVLAARAMGADFAYIGTRFIATTEANAVTDYKAMVLESGANDIVYTPYFTGVSGNYLKGSILNAGLDPGSLDAPRADRTSLAGESNEKAWKDIWGAGQGVGSIDQIAPAAQVIARLAEEYDTARAALLGG